MNRARRLTPEDFRRRRHEREDAELRGAGPRPSFVGMCRTCSDISFHGGTCHPQAVKERQEMEPRPASVPPTTLSATPPPAATEPTAAQLAEAAAFSEWRNKQEKAKGATAALNTALELLERLRRTTNLNGGTALSQALSTAEGVAERMAGTYVERVKVAQDAFGRLLEAKGAVAREAAGGSQR